MSSAVLASLVIELAANVAGFESDLKRADSIFAANAKKMGAVANKAGVAIAAGIAVGATALTVMVKAAVDSADEINKFAQKSGLAVEKISALKYAAAQGGVEFNAFQSSVLKLEVAIAKAAGGSEKQVKAFKALGVNIESADGKIKSADQTLYDIADRFKGMEDGAAKTALAVSVFGKSGADLIPVLNGGSAAIRQMEERADQLGIVFSGNLASSSEVLNDRMDDMRQLVFGLAVQVAEKIIPAIAQMSEKFVEAALQAGTFKTAGENIGWVLQKVIEGAFLLKNAFDVVAASIRAIVTVSLSAFDSASKAVGAYTDYLKRAWEAIKNPFDNKTVIKEQIALFEELTAIQQNHVGEVKMALQGVEDEYNQSIMDMGDAIEMFDTQVTASGANTDKAAGSLVDYSGDAEEAAKKLEELQKEHSTFTKNLNALRAQLAGPIAQAYDEYNARIDDLQDKYDRGVITVEELTEAQVVYGEALSDTVTAIEDQMTATEQLISDLEFELELIGKTNEEREKAIVLRGLEADATDEQRARVGSLMDQIQSRVAQDDSSQQWAALWNNSIADVQDAFIGFIDGSTKNFEDFGDQLKQIAKKLLADLVRMFLTNSLNFTGGVSGGAGGGGFGGMLQSLFGGGGAGGAGAMAGALPWLGALGGIAAGINNPGNNAGASAARIGSYGVAGYVGGSLALGALGGATAAAGATAGAGLYATGSAIAGGAVSGGMAAASAIPVVGWIIAALALIDAVSGGKLFGTKYQTKGSTSTFNIGGANAGTASLTLQQERQAALFGGIRRRSVTKPATEEMARAAEELNRDLQETYQTYARGLDVVTDDLFTAAMRTVNKYDKKGKITSTKFFVDINGRSFEESTAELAATRLGAEAILAAVAKSIEDQAGALANTPILSPEDIGDMLVGDPGDIIREFEGRRFTMPDGDGGSGRTGTGAASQAAQAITNEVHRIAERWRDDANMLMEGAQFLYAAQSDFVRGVSILGEEGTLTQITDLAEELQAGEETLSQTYARLVAVTASFDRAIELAGVALDKTREEIVRFANDVAESAGGLDRATQLWDNFFRSFYSPEELLSNPLAGLQSSRTNLLEDLGIDTGVTTEQFRALFEEALPTLSADAVVQWLEAAEAIGNLIDAETQLRAVRMQMYEADQAFANFLAELQRGINGAELTQFEQDLADIEAGSADLIRNYTNLALASGRAAPSLEELGQVAMWSARQFDLAVKRLKTRIQDLYTQLAGTSLDRINSAIEELEASISFTGGSIDTIAGMNEDRYNQEIAYLQSLQQFRDSLMLSDLSTLNPFERLNESQSRYFDTLARARTGDAQAQAELQGVIQDYLREAQSFFGGVGVDYDAIFSRVMGDTQGLINMGPTSQPGGGGLGTVDLVPSQALLDLYAERDAMLVEQENAQRLQLAMEILNQIGELINRTGQDLFTVVAEMQIDLGEVISALGIDVMNLTATSVQQLGELAGTLDVQLSDLADHLEVSLGELSDSQSLINDAFEGTMDDLPDNLGDNLRPLFEAVEDATSEADANEALELLRSSVDLLAPEIRNQLAPYLGLDQVDEDPIIDAIDSGSALTVTAIQFGNALLQQILDAVAGEPPASVYQVSGTGKYNTSDDSAAIDAAATRIVAAIERSARTGAAVARVNEKFYSKDRTV
jgi:hypothetical protein